MKPELGRVEEGVLFEYITLEADQCFAGELAFKTEEDWNNFQNLTGLKSDCSETIYLGKAVRRGYGEAKLCLKKIDAADAGSLLIPLSLDERFKFSDKAEERDSQAGFDWLREKLRTLENRSIGLRRQEGFGRIVVNHPIYEPNWGGTHYWEWPGELKEKEVIDEPLKVFKKWWQHELDDFDQEALWQEKHDDDGLLLFAKTVYLRRFQSKEKLIEDLDRLFAASSKYLWKKELPVREAEIKSKIKLDKKVMEMLCDEYFLKLCNKVKQNHHDPRWPEGLAMLAERIAEKAG